MLAYGNNARVRDTFVSLTMQPTLNCIVWFAL